MGMMVIGMVMGVVVGLMGRKAISMLMANRKVKKDAANKAVIDAVVAQVAAAQKTS